MSLFTDSWAWLAYLDQKDPDHHSALNIISRAVRQRERLVTTDYVLAETITRLFRRDKGAGVKANRALNRLQGFVEKACVQIEWMTEARFAKALSLRVQYLDKPKISFTDFTSMVVMEDLGIQEVITRDAHFVAVNRGFRLLF